MKYPNIEAERARLGMSKEEFAKSLGIVPKTYYNWLNGVNPIPSDVLIEMARMCNAKTDYLLGLGESVGENVDRR
ncbi:helix-turn-helix domain-containing protein [Lacrimispora sp.]|uniref:helix-turn-helix domain-containing protein n=1 Tax=Lacrimispora sp. TaxID=2719234 RepID=UPI00346002EA